MLFVILLPFVCPPGGLYFSHTQGGCTHFYTSGRGIQGRTNIFTKGGGGFSVGGSGGYDYVVVSKENIVVNK